MSAEPLAAEAVRLRTIRYALVLIVLLVGGENLRGQSCVGTMTFDPPNPTSGTSVAVEFIGPGTDTQCQETSVAIAPGLVVVTSEFRCIIGTFFSQRRYTLGTLPVGTYTVLIRFHDDNYDQPREYLCGSLAVGQPSAIPLLSRTAQALLVTALAFGGVLLLGMRSG